MTTGLVLVPGHGWKSGRGMDPGAVGPDGPGMAGPWGGEARLVRDYCAGIVGELPGRVILADALDADHADSYTDRVRRGLAAARAQGWTRTLVVHAHLNSYATSSPARGLICYDRRSRWGDLASDALVGVLASAWVPSPLARVTSEAMACEMAASLDPKHPNPGQETAYPGAANLLRAGGLYDQDDACGLVLEPWPLSHLAPPSGAAVVLARGLGAALAALEGA